MTMHPVSGILAILSLIGIALNIRLDRRCFYWWGAANIGWVCRFWYLLQPAEAIVALVSLATAFVGVYEWKRRGIGKHKSYTSDKSDQSEASK
jgi:hypothetical protein